MDAAESVAKLLELCGYTVRVAHSGKAALEAAAAEAPDVVLLDIGLPEMDGYEVARAMRARSDLSRIRLLALSGFGREEDKRRSREAGFDAHLVKPADLESLRSAIDGTERTK
jgi:CheY-like chemotaxis protein